MEGEAVGVVAELVAEVLVACGRGRRDDGNALQQAGQGQFFVHVEHAFLLECVENFLTSSGQIAERVGRVDVHDVEAVAVEFVERCANLDQHLHTGREPLSCGSLEMWTEQCPGVCPDLSAGSCDDAVAVVGFLDKFEVAVAAGLTGFGQFGTQPHGLVEMGLDESADVCVEFVEGQAIC